MTLFFFLSVPVTLPSVSVCTCDTAFHFSVCVTLPLASYCICGIILLYLKDCLTVSVTVCYCICVTIFYLLLFLWLSLPSHSVLGGGITLSPPLTASSDGVGLPPVSDCSCVTASCLWLFLCHCLLSLTVSVSLPPVSGCSCATASCL